MFSANVPIGGTMLNIWTDQKHSLRSSIINLVLSFRYPGYNRKGIYTWVSSNITDEQKKIFKQIICYLIIDYLVSALIPKKRKAAAIIVLFAIISAFKDGVDHLMMKFYVIYIRTHLKPLIDLVMRAEELFFLSQGRKKIGWSENTTSHEQVFQRNIPWYTYYHKILESQSRFFDYGNFWLHFYNSDDINGYRSPIQYINRADLYLSTNQNEELKTMLYKCINEDADIIEHLSEINTKLVTEIFYGKLFTRENPAGIRPTFIIEGPEGNRQKKLIDTIIQRILTSYVNCVNPDHIVQENLEFTWDISEIINIDLHDTGYIIKNNKHSHDYLNRHGYVLLRRRSNPDCNDQILVRSADDVQFDEQMVKCYSHKKSYGKFPIFKLHSYEYPDDPRKLNIEFLRRWFLYHQRCANNYSALFLLTDDFTRMSHYFPTNMFSCKIVIQNTDLYQLQKICDRIRKTAFYANNQRVEQRLRDYTENFIEYKYSFDEVTKQIVDRVVYDIK
jgi:hypothetical protein